MKKFRKYVAIAMVPLFLVACASFVKNSYLSLDGTAITYSTAVIAAKQAKTAGKVTDVQWASINSAGKIFHPAFDLSVDALKSYKNNPSTTTQESVTYAISQLLLNWSSLANLINQIIPGLVPVSSMNAVTLKGKSATGQKMTVSIKKLDTGDISIIIQIGSAVVAYLIPAITSFINDMTKTSITDADLDALKTLVKDPDAY